MHDPIIMPVTQEETKAELRSRGYSVEIPPSPPPDDEEHEPIIEPHEPPSPPPVIEEPHEPVIEPHEPLPPPPPIELEHHEPIIPLPIAEVDDRTQMIAGIVYAAFCLFIDEKHIVTFNW